MRKPKSGFITEKNMILANDHYQFTMAAGYYSCGMEKTPASFNLFFRKLPKNRAFMVCMGLEQALHYLTKARFSEKSIEWLRKRPEFEKVPADFFDEYLPKFKFTGDVKAIPEGTIVFPNEPLLNITAPIIEAQLAETYLLSTVGFQTKTASTAARTLIPARKHGKKVVDFGTRRVSPQDGVYVGRACYGAGCNATSNDLAASEFDIQHAGTHAHSWIQAFPSELDAFIAYASVYPKNMIALIDTYNTIRGAKRATSLNTKLQGVRLDSNPLDSDSIKVRAILDNNGQEQAIIVASNDLNAYKIEDLLDNKKAPIDTFGVGTEMSCSKDAPTLGVVYKLVEVGIDLEPRIKLSSGKITYPARKQVYRQDNWSHDVLSLESEVLEGKPLLVETIKKGKLVYELPSMDKIQEHTLEQLDNLPGGLKRLRNFDKYEVKTGQGLLDLVSKLTKKWSEM